MTFGYVNMGSVAITNVPPPNDAKADPTHSLNWFEPEDRAWHLSIPTVFKPGYNPRAFTIRWLCIGMRAHTYNEVSWSLAGQRLVVPGTAERCNTQGLPAFGHSNARERIQEAQERVRDGASKVFG